MRIIKVSLMLILFSLTINFQAKAENNLVKLPSLTGKDALKHLQMYGLNNSLEKALVKAEEKVGFNQKLIASDVSHGATFGHRVAISGDTAVIGAWQDSIGRIRYQGSVYVFVLRKNVWVQQAKLIAADGRRRDGFGKSVAIDGNTIVVGALEADIGKDRNQGAAYVFTRTGNNWGKQVKLEASGGRAINLFGSSVDISGDTIIVGAPGVDNFLNDKVPQANGAAYIFKKINDDWVESQKLYIDSKKTGTFGINVAIDNKTAVISAAIDDPTGAVYIFSDDGTGWKKEHRIVPQVVSENLATEKFTATMDNLAIDGDTVVIGGSYKGEKSNGVAYVYIRKNGKWTQQAKLTSTNGKKGDSFAWSLDISGDNIVIGEHLSSNQMKGSVYWFKRKMTNKGAVWIEQNIITAPDGKLYDLFGISVAIDGDKILVGADNHDYNQRNSNKGTAYTYTVPGISVNTSVF